MDVFTSYHKTAMAPQQGYKSILMMPTRIEEGNDRYCLMSHQWNFDETGAPIAKSLMEFCQKSEGRLEHSLESRKSHNEDNNSNTNDDFIIIR
nr:hypothetical protein [Tanacetum cinerariifolium]